MLLVVVALGSIDLLFALDSIPAIYGLTEEPYLVLTANLFALMGLRQLYFLIGGLLRRLVYLSVGLSVLLGFIGVKLVLHALHENSLPLVNGGEPVAWARTSRPGCRRRSSSGCWRSPRWPAWPGPPGAPDWPVASARCCRWLLVLWSHAGEERHRPHLGQVRGDQRVPAVR